MVAQQGGAGQELNPDGTEKKKRRAHSRWKEEEVLKLVEGVETLGVGHWRQMCAVRLLLWQILCQCS